MAKPKDTIKVEPASASQPRPRSTTPSKQAVKAAVEQSAEFLQEQTAPPSDAHPKPTTPTKAEIASAVEQSAEYLLETGQTAVPETRDKGQDAHPVSAGGANPGLDAAPVSGARDKTQDASPIFAAPIPNSPPSE